jgi:flagellar biosynthesis/type III secretory pathway protein FliH
MSVVFVRNFDIESDSVESNAEVDSSQTELMVSREQAQLLADQARQKGFDEGLKAGTETALNEERTSRSARTDEAICVVSQQLFDLANRDTNLRAEIELQMAELIIGISERVLPDLFEVFLPDVLLARIKAALTIASGTGQIKVRISPEMESSLAARIANIVDQTHFEQMEVHVVGDPMIEDGAVKVDWQSGFMEYDPAIAAMEAIEILREAVEELKTKLGNEVDV